MARGVAALLQWQPGHFGNNNQCNQSALARHGAKAHRHSGLNSSFSVRGTQPSKSIFHFLVKYLRFFYFSSQII
jgi:hypothetical protein